MFEALQLSADPEKKEPAPKSSRKQKAKPDEVAPAEEVKAEPDEVKVESEPEVKDEYKEKVKKWHQKNGGWDKNDEENYDAYAEIKSHIDFVTEHLEDCEDVLKLDEASAQQICHQICH